ILEFQAPRFIYANTADENYAALTSIHRQVAMPEFIQRTEAAATAGDHRDKGKMYLKSESFAEAINEFKLALAANPEDQESWSGILQAGRSLHVRSAVKPVVEQISSKSESPVIRLAAADFYFQEGNSEKAVSLIRDVLNKDSRNVAALEKLADIEVDQGSVDLPATVERLLTIDPENAKGLYHLASIRFYQQRFDEAIQLAKRSLAKDSENARARNLLAIVYGQTFQQD